MLVVTAVLLLVFAVIPLLVAILDLVILLLLMLAGGIARVLLRRPWIVEASTEDGGQLRWRVVGWRASGERRDEVAALLEAGIVPPHALG